jgi:aspartate-semialdehyde dehydrogenase
VVPEINEDRIFTHKGLIANPNCTTIQAVVSLGGIYKNFGLEKFILVSFQATSGAGKKASLTLWRETKEIVEKNKDVDFDQIDKKIKASQIFGYQIAFNVIPKIGDFKEYNYTSEEWKVVKETHKILDDSSIKITATCVRVPVFTSHSEAIYFKTKKDATLKEVEEVVKETRGVKYFPADFPLPLEVEGKDEVFVARLREDPFERNCFWLWSVSDNLRKGAALNAVQIAEVLAPSLI